MRLLVLASNEGFRFEVVSRELNLGERIYSRHTTYLYIQGFSKLAMPDARHTGRRLDFGSNPNVRN